MVDEEKIRQQAKRLHLSNLKNNLQGLLEQAQQHQLSYIAFLELVLTSELDCRENTARSKRIREAHFPYLKRLDGFDFSDSVLSERQANQLAELKWLKEQYNIILIGPPGTGKTHLSIALGLTAAENGFNVSFVTMQELVRLLKSEDIQVRSHTRLEKIRKSDLIIIDEVGYLPITPREAGLFFHMLNEVYTHASLIITSNKSFDKWAEFFGDSDMVLAALDRILFHCEIIRFEGESYRIQNRKSFLT